MDEEQNIFCVCGLPLCTCGISTPVRATASGWLPPTPAATTVKKPAVSMPGWTATTSTPSTSLSTTSSSSPALTVTSTLSPATIAPEIGGVRGPRYSPGDRALQLISDVSSAMAEKDRAMDILSNQHKADMIALHGQYREDLEAWQSKFYAMHFLCLTFTKEMRKKDEKLDLLREGDRIQRVLSQQQQQLARSTMALAKNHRTKFVTDRHQLVYRSTDSTPEVQQELSLANERLRAEKAKQERASMTRLSNTVDQLAKKYDRYNLLTHTNVLNTRCDADGLPCIVPRELMGIWLFADTMDPTTEESAMYEFHLNKQIRPPPIYSPNLPRPTVNWANLNKHRRKNLPDPELFPVHSVPADPTFYTDRTKYKPADQHNNGEDPMKSARIISGKDCGCAKCVPPFGRRYGLMTDMGVIAMPDTSVHGYKWDDYVADWVIATGC